MHDKPDVLTRGDSNGEEMRSAELRRATAELQLANSELRMLAEEMTRAREQAERRADELAALNRVALSLTNVSDLRESLRMVARELTEVFQTRGSTITLIHESGHDAEVVAEYFHDPTLPSVLGLKVPLDTPAWARLNAERRAIVIDRPGEDSILGSVRDVMRARQVAQLLVAPLLSRDGLIGNLSVSHEPGRTFSADEVMLAQTLAGPVAQAVENARLYKAAQKAREDAEAMSRRLESVNQELARLSLTDALTGVANRRHFHAVIDSEWRRAQRSSESLAVLMIDVDLFKAYNDHYGHQMGDICLARTAAALQSGLTRAGDFLARYGGEEFVVILAGFDKDAARAQAERLCQRVRALGIPHEASTVATTVTASIGCAATIPSAASTPETLVDTADRALYEAKRSGRDRVMCASEIR